MIQRQITCDCLSGLWVNTRYSIVMDQKGKKCISIAAILLSSNHVLITICTLCFNHQLYCPILALINQYFCFIIITDLIHKKFFIYLYVFKSYHYNITLKNNLCRLLHFICHSTAHIILYLHPVSLFLFLATC